MERSSPSPQIYQKFICMWNSPHRTPSEPWQKTPDFQKGKPISSEWGRAKDTGKKDTVGLRWDLHPREGVVEGKVFTRLKTPRRQFWGEIQNLRGEQSNRCVEGKMERISLRGLCWTALPSQKGAHSPTAAGDGLGARAQALGVDLRGRTRVDGHEDTLRGWCSKGELREKPRPTRGASDHCCWGTHLRVLAQGRTPPSRCPGWDKPAAV